MRSFVDFEVVTAAEALAAVGALVVPLATVDKLVTLEVGGVSKGQITLVTLVRFLLRVSPGMGLEVAYVGKLLACSGMES